MNEKELLEKAARASGIELQLDDDGVLLWAGDGFVLPFSSKAWNPLTDDGDALRLAVKLRISLIHEQEYMGGPVLETVEATSPMREDWSRHVETECINEQGCDEMARVRLDITRAAAAMAKE